MGLGISDTSKDAVSPVIREELELQHIPRSSAQPFELKSRQSIDDEKISDTAEKVGLGDPDNSSDRDDGPASFALYSSEEEQTVLRKFDRHLVLFIALLYMLCFLDRSSM